MHCLSVKIFTFNIPFVRSWCVIYVFPSLFFWPVYILVGRNEALVWCWGGKTGKKRAIVQFKHVRLLLFLYVKIASHKAKGHIPFHICERYISGTFIYFSLVRINKTRKSFCSCCFVPDCSKKAGPSMAVVSTVCFIYSKDFRVCFLPLCLPV